MIVAPPTAWLIFCLLCHLAVALGFPPQTNGGRWSTLLYSRKHIQYGVEASSRENTEIPFTLTELLVEAGISIDSIEKCEAMDSQDGAFCNKLYRLRLADVATPLIAKVFSPLAMQRMQSINKCLQLHEIVGEQGLGPKVVATSILSETAMVLMQECCGRTLTEADLHGSNVSESTEPRKCLEATAKTLARFHMLELPLEQGHSLSNSGSNVLFRSCEVMLSLCEKDWNVVQGWDFDRLRLAFQHEKELLLDQLSEDDLVRAGHGDCKAANVMVLTGDTNRDDLPCRAQLIDLELTGMHFRSYDLAKLFRTKSPTPFSNQNRRVFLEQYASAYNEQNTKRNNGQDAPQALDPDELERQSDLILPLTWLEAAIFFVCTAASSLETMKWNELAADRLACYNQSVSGSKNR